MNIKRNGKCLEKLNIFQNRAERHDLKSRFVIDFEAIILIKKIYKNLRLQIFVEEKNVKNKNTMRIVQTSLLNVCQFIANSVQQK